MAQLNMIKLGGSARNGERMASDRPLVKSAQRTVQLLEVLGASMTPLGMGEIHRVTGIPRSSLHELIRTLVAMHWIDSTHDGLAFSIGPNALLTGTSYLDADPTVTPAIRHLEALQAEVGYTAHFARLDGAHIIYLASKETPQKRHVTPRVGRRLLAVSTALGRALLAERTPAEVEAILAASVPAKSSPPNTPTSTDPSLLYAVLEEARAHGYATEREQVSPNIACVAATVPYRIPATDAISCSLPIEQGTPEELARVSRAIIAHCAELAEELKRAGVR